MAIKFLNSWGCEVTAMSTNPEKESEAQQFGADHFINTTGADALKPYSNRFDMVMVRLGFGYYGSPYKASISNTNRLDFSAGVGFRFGNWFTDLGFVHSQYEEDEQPYTLTYPAPTGAIAVPTATIGNSLNNVALTLGWKF